MEDNFKHQGLRKKLVQELRTKGIKNENILKAIEKIPRHFFIDSSFINFAYQDKPFPILAGQTISQPYTVAFQTELLDVKKGEKILEVGTGSGYQACVLVEMGAIVYTIERIKVLYDKVRDFLPKIGYNPRFFYGDGYKGLASNAPFDKIIVTAGATEIPEQLLKQLKINGIMIIPVGEGDSQTMISITKKSEKEYIKKEHGAFRFVPLLNDKTIE